MSAQRISDILAPWFERGELPECVALLVDRADAGCPRGTIFDWSQERRGYVARGRDVVIIPEYVRQHWATDFYVAAEAVA